MTEVKPLPKREIIVVSEWGAVTTEGGAYWTTNFTDDGMSAIVYNEKNMKIASFNNVQFIAYKDEVKVLVADDEAPE